jgi:hypothetical protein
MTRNFCYAQAELTDFSEVFLLLLDYLQPKTAKLLAVMPLFRFAGSEGFCGLPPPPRCFFFCKNSENSGACMDRGPAPGPPPGGIPG